MDKATTGGVNATNPDLISAFPEQSNPETLQSIEWVKKKKKEITPDGNTEYFLNTSVLFIAQA